MVCIKPLMHIMDTPVVRTPRRRREHSAEFMRDLVARSLEPGVSVAAIAMEGGNEREAVLLPVGIEHVRVPAAPSLRGAFGHYVADWPSPVRWRCACMGRRGSTSFR